MQILKDKHALKFVLIFVEWLIAKLQRPWPIPYPAYTTVPILNVSSSVVEPVGFQARIDKRGLSKITSSGLIICSG